MASLQDLFPQYGIYNEHWKNHPAGLPVSQYTPGNNPNTGSAAYNRYAQQLGTPATTPAAGGATTPPATTTPAPGTTTSPATTGNGTAWYDNGVKPTTGFASRYTPAMMNQAYESPWSILPDVYQGMSLSSPMYQALRDMGADPLTLFNIMKGSQGMVTDSAPDFINWLADLYGERGKVGGKNFDAKELINAIFGQDKFGANSPNSLGQVLGAGDMGTQIRTLFNLTKDVSDASLNPLSAKAYQAAMQQAGDQYQSEMLKTPATATGPVNPAAWIREHYPDLTLGLGATNG